MDIELHQLIAALPGQVWVALPDGRVEFVSQRWCAYTGISQEQVIGFGWQAAIHPDDRDRVSEFWRSILECRRPGEVETRLRRHDGEYRRFLISVSPISDESGRILKWCGLNIDVEDRRQAEESQRISESELSRTHYHLTEGQRLSQTASFSSDPTIDEHTWSDEFYRICDFEVGSEATLQRFRDIVHPDDRAFVDAVIEGGLAGHDFDFLFRIVTPKGAVKHLRSVGRVVDRIAGRPILVGAVQGVTSTKLAEAALRASERDLRAIADAIPAGVVLLSAAGAVEVANQALLQYFGKTNEELTGSGSNDSIHPEDLTHSTTSLEQSLATGAPYDIEQRLRRFDGTYRWFHVQGHPILDADGKIARWYILYTDIDPRKRTEEELRETEWYIRLALDSIPGMVCVHTADGQIEFVNRTILDYFGSTPEELARWQTGDRDLVHPEDRAWVFSRFAQAMASGEPWEWENRAPRYDGVYRWVQTRGSPLRDESGRIVRWYNLIIDVDDRKRAEEALKLREVELRRAYDRLNEGQRLMTMGTFAASIAHEVNQPLSAIIADATTCLRRLAADPPNIDGARTTAQRMLREGNRASQVIQHLRILFSRQPPKNEPVQLNDAVREVIALCSHELQRNRIILQTNFDQSLPAVMGDRVQLQQVVLNLIVNAIDAMMKVDDRRRDLLVATAREAPDRVRFRIRDSGVGIDPANVVRLFDAFFTTKGHGMGVGLSISRSIIESHEGRIWATANEGPGFTFSFWIPCSSEPLASQAD
jgi:PAS domain S-box-containing protein